MKMKIKTGSCSPLWLAVLLAIFTQVGICQAKDYTDKELWSSPGKIKGLLATGQLEKHEVPDPHWQDGACQSCHTGSSGFNKSNLRTRDTGKMCGSCHNEHSKTVFVHPVGLNIPRKMFSKMPKNFQQSLSTIGSGYNNKMSCLTCHDVAMQCVKSRRDEKTFNSGFYRLGPYRDRTKLCFYCHDKKDYQRFSPHDQVLNGQVKKKVCNVCHKKTQQLTASTKSNDVVFHAKNDMTQLCTNCHPWKPHPGWEYSFSQVKKTPNHLVKPTDPMLVQMNNMKKLTGVTLPLEPGTGKIYCATCHNPHEKGVIRSATANAGADSKKRVRIKELCAYCHDF